MGAPTGHAPKPVSGDEHPSGLRDAIALEIANACDDWDEYEQQNVPEEWTLAEFLGDRAYKAVVAWLFVVSEEQIDAAVRAIAALWNSNPWLRATSPAEEGECREFAEAALAASREVRRS